jgi:hypothetical protein
VTARSVVVAAGLLLLAVGPLHGQAQVAIIEKSSLEPSRAEIQARLAPPLTWDQKKAILLRHGVGIPARPPAQLTLTPRAPYRVPGGYIALDAAHPGTWRPYDPAPTGHINITAEWPLSVVLAGAKANTRYLLDIYVWGYSAKIEINGCGASSSGSQQFPVDGDRHLLVIVPTNGSGNACVSLDADPIGIFLKVELADIGPP